MWDDDELIEVIHASPAVVDDALRAIQQDGGAAPIDLDAFTAAAGVLGTDPARLCVDQLRARGLLAAFQAALLARGIPAPAVDGNGRGTAVTRGGGGRTTTATRTARTMRTTSRPRPGAATSTPSAGSWVARRRSAAASRSSTPSRAADASWVPAWC
ncbi:hypothetical protein [Agromyces flavus]|uniref:hypothetical protein n=1 Tax=Agromyces flavus TaxID=589382 RepID=UPI003615D87D